MTGKWLTRTGILIGHVRKTEGQGILIALVSHLVDGGFKGQRTNGMARCAARIGNRHIDRLYPVRTLECVGSVGGPSRGTGWLGKFVTPRHRHEALVADCLQLAVPRGAQLNTLHGATPVRRVMEDVAAMLHDFDGSFQM